ncbi:hypothetical protein PCANC_03055 [Puccinia coronata f. sp. avenae]|uniref:Uncharacterized protein n=1 Tax=Puccinia coronata f. sp. avenae TaxID=200324 RepID=A0A2N5W4W2_9BASI|nr:hypothetical protein PCASD_07897 [Puccinia coronata f. sp. avenae]PLW57240.1 hypothetical protein PCANC_03055 [Puccinia coronata f. sp. avenae]
MYSSVRLCPCLLAYLILTSVAIVLASPCLDLNHPPFDLEGARKALDAFDYKPYDRLDNTANSYWEKFKTLSQDNYNCLASLKRQKHPSLSLSLLGSPASDKPPHQIIRITYAESHYLVGFKPLKSSYRALIAYVNKVHEWHLDECDIAENSRDELRAHLFEWIHQALFDHIETETLPLIGTIPGVESTWESLKSTNRFTETQKVLLGYLSEEENQDVVATSIKLLAMYMRI